MSEKPSFASQYGNEQVEFVRQTCLYVATKLGDLLHDLIVVGGLVPSLLHPRKWVAINRIRFCYFITSVPISSGQ